MRGRRSVSPWSPSRDPLLRARVLRVWLALIVGGAMLSACGHTDPAIQIEIDVRLSADRITAPLTLDVAVNRGRVRLDGEVQSEEQRTRALDVARGVPGVRTVADAMHFSDATVVAAVVQALAADPLVGKIPFTVNAHEGTVQLISDQTGPDDRVRAVEVASRVTGVQRVEDLMR